MWEIYKVEREDIYSRSRQKLKSDARALFCFCAVRELGYGQRELARRPGFQFYQSPNIRRWKAWV
jgi:hypothetical protein